MILRAVEGVWCPWGAVLCLDCHGQPLRGTAEHDALKSAGWYPGPRGEARRAIDDRSWLERFVEREPCDDEGIGRCDKCSRLVTVRTDVAMLCQIRDRLATIEDAPAMELRQTGGMCAALVGDNDRRIVVVTGWDGPGLVGVYLPTDEDWNDPIDGEGGEFSADDIEAGAMLVIGAFAARPGGPS